MTTALVVSRNPDAVPATLHPCILELKLTTFESMKNNTWHRRSSIENWFGLALILSRFVFCCYRAATQSIITDEAMTFERFVDGPWSRLYSRFDANNHVLHTILVKLSVKVFGLSEVSVRLPSLIGGLLLTVACFCLLKNVRTAVFRWTAFLAICLHPLLLDFCVAARGYGLGLALFAWALYFFFKERLVPAGFLLGAAMSANLALVFPTLGLLFAIFVLQAGDLRARIAVLRSLLIPAVSVFAVICSASLWTARRDDFYLGYSTFKPAFVNFVFTSIHAKIDHEGLFGSGEAASAIALYFMPIVGVVSLLHGFFEWGHDAARYRLIPLVTLAITIIGLSLAHLLFGLKYPMDRTCLYFVLLAAMSWAITGDAMKDTGLKIVWLLPAVLFVIQFTTQIQARYFQYWTVETDDKQVAQIISSLSRGRPGSSMTVSTSWIHQASLEFYRTMLSIRALKPVALQDEVALDGSDVYVVSGTDLERMKHAPELKTVFADARVGVMVLQPIGGLSGQLPR